MMRRSRCPWQVHYVSQEVQLDEEKEAWTPVQFVVHADIERRMLLAEQAELSAEGAEGSAESGIRLAEVQVRLYVLPSH